MTSQEPEHYVLLAGGANLDVLGFSAAPLIPRDSNPGRIRFGAGGVIRNVAENLSLLGIRTELITATGSGTDGEFIRNHCISAGIGIRHSITLKEDISSTYIAMMDSDGDMALALSDMSTTDHITPEYLRSKKNVIAGAGIIAADTNLSFESLEYLATGFPGSRLCIDPVSVAKALKLRPLLGNIHTLKMNRLEAESITGFPLNSRKEIRRAGDFFREKGTRRIFITSGKGGVYWADQKGEGFHIPPAVTLINATGAGDAFTAGVVFSTLQNFTIHETLKFSSALAGLTIAGEEAVNGETSLERIRGILAKQH